MDHKRNNLSKKVCFQSEYEEIGPPEYASQSGGSEDELNTYQPTPTPTQRAASKSVLKKQKIQCRIKDGSAGSLCVNSGKVIFIPAINLDNITHEHCWSIHLGEISHLDIEDSCKETKEYSLVFYLFDRTRKVFTNVSSESNAFQTIVDDAEMLGFVLVVDQLLPKESDAFVSLTLDSDYDPKKKKRGSLILGLVPKNTTRFINDKFNLDLTYITRRLIVMAYPGDGMKGITWNNAKDVKRFFETRHPHAYMVYNLNIDNGFVYDYSRFDGRVREFGFADHSPPPLLLLVQICADIAAFLKQQPCNTVAVHCKAGKGRSGTVACAWLLYSHLFDSAEKAVEYYDSIRVSGMKAISLPSQVRYIQYMERIIRFGSASGNILKLLAIELSPSPISKGTILINILSENDIYTTEARASEGSKFIEMAESLSLKDDVKIDLYADNTRNPIFTLYFNTRMLEGKEISFERNVLDGERDYKGFKYLVNDFKITLHYDITSFIRHRRALLVGRSTGPRMMNNYLSTKDDCGASLSSSPLSSPAQSPMVSRKVTTKEFEYSNGMIIPKIERKSTGWINRHKEISTTTTQILTGVSHQNNTNSENSSTEEGLVSSRVEDDEEFV